MSKKQQQSKGKEKQNNAASTTTTTSSSKKPQNSKTSAIVNPASTTTSSSATPTTTVTLPPLPNDITAISVDIYRGPTDYTNWVIPQRLLVGSYPRAKALRPILECGINHFVNLVEAHEIERYSAYIDYAQTKSKAKLSYIHFPIRDHGIASDAEVIKLVKKLETVILGTSDIVYMHCVGGHGRTGTIVSLLLAKLYSLDSYSSIDWCQALHDARVKTNERQSPESSEQRNQIHKLVPKICKSEGEVDE